jgi:hypothetical protein
MFCAYLAAVVQFGILDGAYYVRKSQTHDDLGAITRCRGKTGTYYDRRGSLSDFRKTTCPYDDDVVVCYNLNNAVPCTLANDITYEWAVALIIFIYSIFVFFAMLLAVVMVFKYEKRIAALTTAAAATAAATPTAYRSNYPSLQVA